MNFILSIKRCVILVPFLKRGKELFLTKLIKKVEKLINSQLNKKGKSEQMDYKIN